MANIRVKKGGKVFLKTVFGVKKVQNFKKNGTKTVQIFQKNDIIIGAKF